MSQPSDEDLHSLFAIYDDDELTPPAQPAAAKADHEPAGQQRRSEAKTPQPPQEQPLYLDDEGVPMLFDVAIPGERLKAAGVVLAPPNPGQSFIGGKAAASPTELAAQIEAAIEAALPAATEQAASALRKSLLAEVQQRLEPQSTDKR